MATPQEMIYTVPQMRRASARKEILKKKLVYFTWLDTPADFRRPVLVKDVERALNVAHPTFVHWGQEYRSQHKLGLRVQAQVAPQDLAGFLVQKLEMSQKMLLTDEPSDPMGGLQHTTEAAAWLTLGNILTQLNSKIGLCSDPETLGRLSERVVDVTKKIEEMVLARLPSIKAEAQQLSLQTKLGTALNGIQLPGMGDSPMHVLPAQAAVDSSPSRVEEEEPATEGKASAVEEEPANVDTPRFVEEEEPQPDLQGKSPLSASATPLLSAVLPPRRPKAAGDGLGRSESTVGDPPNDFGGDE